MLWVMLWVGLGTAGIVVLGACGFKVLLALRALGRELERTRNRLEPKQEALRRERERTQPTCR